MHKIILAEKLARFYIYWDSRIVAKTGNSGAPAAAKDPI